VLPGALGTSLVAGAVWLAVMATSHPAAASAAAPGGTVGPAGPAGAVAATSLASAAPTTSRVASVAAGAQAPTPTATSCVPTAPNSARLAAAVDAELRTRPGTYGVGVVNLDSGEGYLLNPDRRFPAGSVYKLAVLYETWQRVQSGGLSLDTILTIDKSDTVEPEPAGGPALGSTITVRDALESMVTISSNSAAHALLRTLGRDSINRSMRGIGLRDTIIPTPETLTGVVDEESNDVATTSPRDALCCMSRLGHDQLVSPEASAGMRGTLLRQKLNDRLPAFLPDEARVAHKTGEISGVRNDVGIVYSPHGAWAIAILSRDVDEGDATAVIARISRRLYDVFDDQPGSGTN
jgi:beta-lactamase class A